MEITKVQYDKIKYLLPVQHSNVTIDNITFINALLYICENGCKWRRLAKEFGKWHSIYKRYRYWLEKGYIDKLFQVLCVEKLANQKSLVFLLDNDSVSTPRCLWCFKKRGPQAIGRSKGGLTSKIHMMACGYKSPY